MFMISEVFSIEQLNVHELIPHLKTFYQHLLDANISQDAFLQNRKSRQIYEILTQTYGEQCSHDNQLSITFG